MTDAEIVAEFERLEAEGKRRPAGPDYGAIVDSIVRTSKRRRAEVVQLVLDTTFAKPV